MTKLRRDFLAFDGALAQHGVPALSSWWRDSLGTWLDAYERDHVLELWACVGRGAAKSTALYKLACFFALFGTFHVPPGEVHYAIVLSRLKEEASKGVAIIDRWLTLLQIPHKLAGDVIDLTESQRGIRVVAASVAATSGWRAFFVGRDERSKWAADGAIEQDADEIDTSSAAMTATHRFAPSVSVGSAWGMGGSFYDAITSGSDATRVVLGPTPTWLAAPHITEEDTRRKERNPSRWAREYACQFQPTESAAFDPEAVRAAFVPRELRPPQDVIGERLIIIDASSLKADSFAWCSVFWVRPALGRPFLVVGAIDSVPGGWDLPGIDHVVNRIAALAKELRASSAHGDQREAFALRTLFSERHLPFIEHPWTNAAKVRAVERVRALLRDGGLFIEEHETMRSELLGFEEKITTSGSLTYGARGKQHDDFVALLLTAAMAEEAGFLRCPELDAPTAGGETNSGFFVYANRPNISF